MDLLDLSLNFSILSCSLVTGFIFTYAIIVMPGLSKLENKEFIRAFQVTDEVIQKNQPLFMLTWIGSIISVIAAILVSIVSTGLSEAWLIVLVGAIYLSGVQGITISIHLPLNNHIQQLNVGEMNDQTLNDERVKFEAKWNFFNYIRTVVAFSVSLMFIVILTLR